MKKLLIIFLLCLCVSAGFLDKFKQFINKYKKNFDRLSAAEKSIRQKNFLKNFNLIEKFNKLLRNRFKVGLNEFSDRDPKKFVKEMCGTRFPARPRSLAIASHFYSAKILESVD